MIFFIRVTAENSQSLLKCETLYSSSFIEHIRVSNNDWYILLQSNRPLLLCKGIRYNKIKWEVIEGKIESQTLLDSIIQSLENKLG